VRGLGRLIRLLVATLLVLALVVGGLGAAITWRALPQTNGRLVVAGLDSAVTIIRDDAGIARILADTPHDLFLAQGYVHAQDRMWQMEVWRHISAGRLSELFGASTLENDRYVRVLGWRDAAKRDLEAMSPTTRAALDAYAEGVNAWLTGHRGSLALPFVVTALRSGTGGLGGYDPEPWTPLDSVAWQKVQAWNLGGNLDEEIFRMLADARLGDPALTDSLFPAYRAGAPIITPADRLAAKAGPAAGVRPAAAGAGPARAPGVAVTPTAEQAAAWRSIAAAGDRTLAIAGLGGSGPLAGEGGLGSNNWVVSGSLSATGGALLANDPHLGIGMPSVWYMNGLHCRNVSAACPYDVVGVSFPGTPAVVLGHNGRIAWGATNVDPDVQDLFVERIDAANVGNYLAGAESVPFTVRRETIRIAGGGSETIEVRSTRHGPLLNDVDIRLEDAPPVALRWAATTEVDGTLEAILRLNTAADFEQFRAALSGYGSPAQHFVYADVDGHIGYQLPGRIPIRAGGATGSRPVAGDSGAAEWTGYIPFAELPWQYDPAGGLIVTANNAPTDEAYPHRLGDQWDFGYRAERIADRLERAAADGISIDEIHDIQLDTTPLRAARLQRSLAAPAVVAATDDGKAMLELIRTWKLGCPSDSRGCAAYHAFEYRLLGAIFEDELGTLARDYVGGAASFETAMALLERPDDPWWDDTRTDGRRETAPVIVTRALDRAAAELRTSLGSPESWTWGAMHRASFREETLGASGIAPLEWYLNRGPVPVSGAPGAVLNNHHRPELGYADPSKPGSEATGLDRVFDVAVAPSYRLTIDLSDLDGARIVQTTGQSGNAFDAHYGDLIERWSKGEWLALPWDRDAMLVGAAATLTLQP